MNTNLAKKYQSRWIGINPQQINLVLLANVFLI